MLKHCISLITVSIVFFQSSVGFCGFGSIPDQYKTIEEVTAALRQSGLESSDLIVGVDFTGSNKEQGKETFKGKPLHHISKKKSHLNYYQSVIQILGQTLKQFDDDNQIPAFGFGDTTTADHSVFSLRPDGKPCQGFEEVLDHYSQAAKRVELSGPTSFAPLIYKAIDIVKQTQSYHILVIITDGVVSDPEVNARAIVEASKYPLSIIAVGVGDGEKTQRKGQDEWAAMHYFDDHLPTRAFDNFQFVSVKDIYKAGKKMTPLIEARFATAALQEIPAQYEAIKSLGYLGKN